MNPARSRTLAAALAALLSLPLAANDVTVRVMQSGSPEGPLSIHERGIRGEGQIVTVMDTGVDWDSCYFAEPDRSRPPVNTGTPGGGLQFSNVDLSRRKIVAYNFLYSCDQYPGAANCDNPQNPAAWDNFGHGTFAAAAAVGDSLTPLKHDRGDAIAPGAKLIVQDTGYVAGSPCALPGLGCPPTDVTPILEQAWLQGSRINSLSWGDRMSTASVYSRQIDAFVHSHPESVIVLHAGNTGRFGPRSITSPGLAKNTIQAGGTRRFDYDDEIVWYHSSQGPTLDGRIKPDFVAPAYLETGYGDGRIDTHQCVSAASAGTSWSAPVVAGAAALVRQYFEEGFYPRGLATPSDRFSPTSALIKATLMASARQVDRQETADGEVLADPIPSYQQGFGFPVLDDALYFAGETRRLRALDERRGLEAGQVREIAIVVRGADLRVALAWVDPPASGSFFEPELVNDLDLEVIAPDGMLYRGNERLHPGNADRLNNAEVVRIASPAPGRWVVRVRASRIGSGPRQGFALAISGELDQPPRRRPVRR